MRARVLTLLAAFLALPLAARADTVYSYTGPDFYWAVDDSMLYTATPPYTTSDFVSGSFTVASPLPTILGTDPDNSENVTDDILSFSFTDGVQTLDNTNSMISVVIGDAANDNSSDGRFDYWTITISQFVCDCGPDGAAIYNSIHTSFGLLDQSDDGGVNWQYDPATGAYVEGQGDLASWLNGIGDPGQWTLSTTTPELNSLILCGTGLVFVAGAIRRRFSHL